MIFCQPVVSVGLPVSCASADGEDEIISPEETKIHQDSIRRFRTRSGCVALNYLII